MNTTKEHYTPDIDFQPTESQKSFSKTLFSKKKSIKDFFKEKKLRRIVTGDRHQSKLKKIMEKTMGPSLLSAGVGALLERKITREERADAKEKLQKMGVNFRKDPTSGIHDLQNKVDALYKKLSDSNSLSNMILGEFQKFEHSTAKNITENMSMTSKILELVKAVPTPPTDVPRETSNDTGESGISQPKTFKQKEDKPTENDWFTDKKVYRVDEQPSLSRVNDTQIPEPARETAKKPSTLRRVKSDENENIEKIVDMVSKNMMSEVKNFMHSHLPDREKELSDIIDNLVKEREHQGVRDDEYQKILTKALKEALKEIGIMDELKNLEDGTGNGLLTSLMGGLAGLIGGKIIGILKNVFGMKPTNKVTTGMSPEEAKALSEGETEVSKGVGKIAAREGSEAVAESVGVAGKVAGKSGGKIASKLGLKAVAKAIPYLGAVVGAGLAVYDASHGDWKGAGFDLASGALSLLGPAGIAAGLTLDAAHAAEDYSDAKKLEKAAENPNSGADLMNMHSESKQIELASKATDNTPQTQQSIVGPLINQQKHVSSSPEPARAFNNDNTFNRLLMQDVDHPSTYSTLHMG